MKPLHAASILISLLAATGCGGPDPVPMAPQWVGLVEPILRANCFSCHGQEWRKIYTVPDGIWKDYRFDIHEPKNEGYADLGATNGIVGAFGTGVPGLILSVVKNPNSLVRMPPPPATPLSGHDIEVLDRWANVSLGTRGERAPNHLPTAKLLEGPKMNGAKWEIKLLITDEDHDQVLGKVTGVVNDEPPILGAGVQTISFNTMPNVDALRVTMFDGQQRAEGIKP